MISKSATTYHCLSTTAYGIVRAQKLEKTNRKQLANTTDPYLSPSTPSYSYGKFNENTDITSKK